MSEFSGIVWVPTGELRILRRWFRRDRLQQEYMATGLSKESDRITEWHDVEVIGG